MLTVNKIREILADMSLVMGMSLIGYTAYQISDLLFYFLAGLILIYVAMKGGE